MVRFDRIDALTTNLINHKTLVSMKKHLLFVALATIFSVNLFAQEPAKPTTVPGAPTMAEEHVMALYCNHYEGNTLNFSTQGWGTQWETLTIEGTKVAYTSGLAWDAVKGVGDSNDLSGYEKIHFDLWAPEAAHVSFTVEALSGYKKAVDFKLNEGWNTIDADTAWWAGYDWKDLKCVIFEQYKNADGIESFEGNPFAFANIYFWSSTTSVTPPDKPAVPKPETLPAAPTHAEADVMALYSSYYATNNLNFNVLGWGGIQTWETLELTDDKIKVLYCQDMKWEMMTNWDKASYDFSGYEKFHFDIWAPFACNVTVTFEALGVGDGGSGWKHGINFKLNEGWNTVDCDPVWWDTDDVKYDWKDVKYIAFEGYKKEDGETSAEGNPFAFTNLYWWKSPTINYPDAPADPTISEGGVMALFSPAYTTNNVGFEPQNWGGAEMKNVDGKFFYTPAMTWDAFTNWDADHYNMTAYDMFSCDIWVEVDANIKITFEALGAGDGGSGWKNGAVVEGLKANQWNHVTVDLLNAPFDSYDFTDMRYLILEGFTNEGSPLGIANAFFWDSMTPVQNVSVEGKAVKRIVNGQIMIEKNGVLYNVLGTQF